jgi:MFS family permease
MPLPRLDGLKGLFEGRQFGVLLASRLTSQAADGVFQASLYGALLFNPDHHTRPAQIAGGLVLLVLPYSLIGPFVGVFLDRWRRQKVLTHGAAIHGALAGLAALLLLTNGSRSIAFEAAAFGALAVNRFYLAAQSAALPYVVREDQLVVGNAFSTTAGTVITIVGGGIGVGVRHFTGSGDHGDALVAAISTIGYLVASAVARRLPITLLGPHDVAATSALAEMRSIATGFVAGAQHVWQRREAARALAVMYGQRALFGVWTIKLLLLYRYSFHAHGPLRAGIVGAGQAATAGGIGLVIAALVTPRVSGRIGRHRWIAVTTALPAVSELAFGTEFSLGLFLISSIALGFAMQATKICVDSTIQASVDADFLGRAFALYDAGSNTCFAVAVVIAAYVMPINGRSEPTVITISAAYLLLAATYALTSRRRTLDSEGSDPGGAGSVLAEQPAEQVA